MSDFAAYLAAVALLTFSAYRLSTDPHSAEHQVQRYGYGLMICLALAMAMLAPSMPRKLAALGMDRITVILLGDCVRTAAVSVLMFMAYTVARRPARGLPVAAAITSQLTSITLFVAARPAIGADDSLLTHGSGRWMLAGYDLVFAGYAAWSVTVAAIAFGREARHAEPGPVRAGIRLSLAALAVAMVWTAWTIDDVVHVLQTGVQDGSEDLVSNTLGAVCAALIVAATLVAKWHAGYAAARDRVQAYRVYRRLTPLWEAMHAELPQIALDDERRVRFGSRSLDFALYRRVIEIHDGRLALRPYAPDHEPEAIDPETIDPETTDPETTDTGRSRSRGSAAHREALVEAASIAAALENHRAGRLRASGEPARRAEAAKSVAVEAAWLAEVATAFSRVQKGSRFRPGGPRGTTPSAAAGVYPD